MCREDFEIVAKKQFALYEKDAENRYGATQKGPIASL